MKTSLAGPLAAADVSTVIIYTRDFDRMAKFYREMLGLAVEHQT